MKDFDVRVYDGCFGLVVSERGVPLKRSRYGTVGSIAFSGVELGTWCGRVALTADGAGAPRSGGCRLPRSMVS